METNDLQNIGMSATEAKVYLACLEVGGGTVLQISNTARIPKSTTFDVLKALTKRGVVTGFKKQNRNHFQISDPSILCEHLKLQLATAQHLLPELRRRYSSVSKQPKAIFYEGEAGVKVVLQEILNEAKELAGIGSAEDVLSEFPFFQTFITERAKRKIPAKIILRDSEKARIIKSHDREELRMTKLINGSIPYNAFILLWKNKITLITTKNGYSAVVVESPDVIAAFKLMFDLFWEQ